jgi:hypothetical protein
MFIVRKVEGEVKRRQWVQPCPASELGQRHRSSGSGWITKACRIFPEGIHGNSRRIMIGTQEFRGRGSSSGSPIILIYSGIPPEAQRTVFIRRRRPTAAEDVWSYSHSDPPASPPQLHCRPLLLHGITRLFCHVSACAWQEWIGDDSTSCEAYFSRPGLALSSYLTPVGLIV